MIRKYLKPTIATNSFISWCTRPGADAEASEEEPSATVVHDFKHLLKRYAKLIVKPRRCLLWCLKICLNPIFHYL